MKAYKIFLISILTIAALSVPAGAKVTLPALMADNMVLQRNTEVNIWGKANPGAKVTVKPSWTKKTYTTNADSEGKWITKVATTDAGGPYSIRISDGEPVTIENVLLGEVWICGGQSNMELQMSGFMHQPVEGAVEAMLDAPNHPNMRFFTVARANPDTPADDCQGAWETSTPESVAKFSAAGYFFGHLLNSMLNVPIGLITSNWGGSFIEAWMDEPTFNSLEGVDKSYAKSLGYWNSQPAQLYNGMINPIKNHTAKGFIWYQGESNRGHHKDFVTFQKALINNWREKWGDNGMPFYMVQLAPYRYEGDNNTDLALMIEAQYEAADAMENVDVVATTDIGNPICIHPGKKKEVGERLAFLALQNQYGIKGLPLPAPRYKSMSVEGNKVTLEFHNLVGHPDWWYGGNTFHSYREEGYVRPRGFEVAGEDKVFYPAIASFGHGQNTIELYSDSVPIPVAVRYYFHNYVKDANVKTGFGQPLVPFRTDRWE